MIDSFRQLSASYRQLSAIYRSFQTEVYLVFLLVIIEGINRLVSLIGKLDNSDKKIEADRVLQTTVSKLQTTVSKLQTEGAGILNLKEGHVTPDPGSKSANPSPTRS